MSKISVHLLGPPAVRREDSPATQPRGHKAWALLAYLLLTESAPTRSWLAELLFVDAEDPLNALSWSLSQLRRLLGPEAEIGGDPVVLTLPAGTFVDVQALTRGTWAQALQIPGLGRPLLEGLSVTSSASFEVWLVTERRRLSGVTQDVLREAARARLATGDAGAAAELAGRLVAFDPLDEDAQELLIRSYAAAGDRAAAERQRDACVALFRSELGVEPGSAVLRAADPVPAASGDRAPSGAAVAARIEAGLAALDAGAVDAGIGPLREAVAAAEGVGLGELRRRALLALGSALVHGVRGRDGEGAGVLHQAIEASSGTGPDAEAAKAHRELGYVEMLRGRYDRARVWLERAIPLAVGAPAEAAWINAVEGVVHGDVGRHSAAIETLELAVRLARESGERPAEAWALAFIGRSRLVRDELVEARESLEQAHALVRDLRWTAFLPLIESFLAEVQLRQGEPERAAEALEHAYALSLQLGDPCWEGVAGRGLGLVAERRGNVQEAMRWLSDARVRCVRLPDAWLWVEGYCLDALCRVAVEHRLPQASQLIEDLEALATHTGMRELVARAYRHRVTMGDRSAVEALRVLSAEVDNPALLGS